MKSVFAYMRISPTSIDLKTLLPSVDKVLVQDTSLSADFVCRYFPVEACGACVVEVRIKGSLLDG